MGCFGTLGLTMGSLMIASTITETAPVQVGMGPFLLWGTIGLLLGGLIPLGGTYMKDGRRISETFKAELTTFLLTAALGFALLLIYALNTGRHGG